MNDEQVMHAMGIDDAYRVKQVLARGTDGMTELVTLDGSGLFVRKRIALGLARRSVWAALADCGCDRLPHVEATYEMPEEFVVVYDFVPGDTLERVVETRGCLSVDDASRLVAQVCEAAGALHARGVIHRDISPTNVIVAADGAHLIDLGIARMRVEGVSHDTTSLGTWGFASPEQYGFAQTDARSDVYSIGRLFGYVLTGVRPDADEYEGLLADATVVPSGVRAVIDRACAFEPSARYQSAAELASAVEALAGGGAAVAVVSDGERMSSDVANVSEGTGWSRMSSSAGTVRSGTHAVSTGDSRKKVRASRHALVALAVVLGIVAVVAMLYLFVFRGLMDQKEGQGPSDLSNNPVASEPLDADDSGMSSQSAGSAPAAADMTPVIVDSGWSVDGEGYVHYAFALKNPSSTHTIVCPEVVIAGRSIDGTVTFSDSQVLSELPPDETIWWGGFAGNGTTPDTVEFIPQKPAEYNVRDSSEGASFLISNVSTPSDGPGNVSFVGEVTTVSDGTPFHAGADVAISVILRDEAGVIVYGDTTFVTRPAAGETTSFEILTYDLPEYATYEVHALVW